MKTVEKNSLDNIEKVLKTIRTKIDFISQKVENLPEKSVEIICIFLYVVLHCILCVYHEPWFDEAQAWNIASEGSLHEILFEVPHYEGHPSLWYLVLLPFAKSECNYAITLSCISLVITSVSVSIFVFKSPFSRLVKALLPFTYFMFYQYGVISRPYCIMVLAAILIASTYSEKDSKPFRYIGSLMLMCSTSAYGIVICFGLSLVWLWKILQTQKIKELVYDKRVYALALLLVYAIFLVVRMYPKESLAVTLYDEGLINNFVVRFLYCLFASISDISLTNAFSTYTYIQKMDFNTPELVAASVIGLGILFLIYTTGKRKKTWYEFSVPYLMFCIFSSTTYLCVHHIGVVWCMVLIFFWISHEKEITSDTNEGNTLVGNVTVIVIACSLLISIVWNVSACISEINYSYCSSKEINEFLSENNYNDMNMLFTWTEEYNADGDLTYLDLKHCTDEVILAPYGYSDNFLNWPLDHKLFPLYHRVVTDEENREILEKMKMGDIPDIIIGTPNLERIYGDMISVNDYELVLRCESGKMWKGIPSQNITYVYKRK